MRLGPLDRLEALRQLTEKATGLRPSAAAMIEALVGEVNSCIHITPAMVHHLAREQAQQNLINSSIRWTMRTIGPDASYEEAYKVYLERARSCGLSPLGRKRFKNRALDEYGEEL